MRNVRRLRVGALTAFLVTAGLLAGCGASDLRGADQNGDEITSPLPVERTITAATTPVSTATRSTGGSTITTVTATVPESSLPGYKKQPVLLGDMNTQEEFVLGQLYAYALRAQGYKVAVSRNIGPPSVANLALHEGTLDVFPDYLDDLDSGLDADRHASASLSTAMKIARAYAHRHGMVLLNPTPFSDTAALAVSRVYARNLGVTSLQALVAGPRPVLGVPLQYAQSPRGLPLIERLYGLRPSYVSQIGIGLQYAALDSNSVQAAYVTTTDPQLDTNGYVLLADPKGAYGIGNVVPVTTAKVLREEGPAFARTLNRVDALLTQQAIRGLNAEVQLNHVDPGTAAREFLQAHGLMPLYPAPVTR